MARLTKQLDPTQTGVEAEKLESDLRRRIVGQDEAIEVIVDIYQTYLAGMASPGRPIGNLLFLGPTGSGKTRLVEATAESLAGDCHAVIKIDCAEFQHSHEIAKLIGSPPGYLGHRETHPLLSQETLNQYQTERMKLSFVLFDEIEKASDALWNLLLGILDKGTLTLGDNRRVDFSRALIFMTSNLGAVEMNSILRPNLGFAARETERLRASGTLDEKLSEKVARAGVEAARRKFTPEFMNRIDKTVVFRPLGEPELRKILKLELNLVQQRLFDSAHGAPFVFSLTPQAQEYLLSEGTDVKYGARHLKRALDRHLVHPLSNLIATDQVRGGDHIRVDFDAIAGRLTFFVEAEDIPASAMAQMAGLPVTLSMGSYAAGAVAEQTQVASARSSKKLA
jgi:ATP-dependent Clp protease ATP-binding subunit ClpB